MAQISFTVGPPFLLTALVTDALCVCGGKLLFRRTLTSVVKDNSVRVRVNCEGQRQE